MLIETADLDEKRWRRVDGQAWLSQCENHSDFWLFHARLYTSQGSYSVSKTNQLIKNFKISPSETHRLHYKRSATTVFVREVTEFLRTGARLADSVSAIVPIPSSKARSDPEYDNRVEEVAKRIADTFERIDYLPLLETTTTRDSLHGGTNARSKEALYQSMSAAPSLTGRRYDFVFILDDVLTSGASFSAVYQHVSENLIVDTAKIIGIFWAKTERT